MLVLGDKQNYPSLRIASGSRKKKRFKLNSIKKKKQDEIQYQTKDKVLTDSKTGIV